MSSRNLFASILMACVLAVGALGIASAANAASAGKSIRKPGESARNYVLEMKRRGRGPRIHLPIGPSYIYYDYPYYYSRGYYPTHTGGYVYYPYFSRNFYPRYGGRCSIWHRGCVAMGGRRQRGACRCL
jgi:hypothetical protein